MHCLQSYSLAVRKQKVVARRNRSWRRTYDYVWCCKSFKKLELMNLYCHSRAQRTRRILMVATRRNLLELFNHSVNGPKWSWVFLPGWSWRERIWFRWKGLFNWLHDLFNNFWDLGWETYTSPKRKNMLSKCAQESNESKGDMPTDSKAQLWHVYNGKQWSRHKWEALRPCRKITCSQKCLILMRPIVWNVGYTIIIILSELM